MMKKQPKQIEEPSYIPHGLAVPTPNEAYCGWTAVALTEMLRTSTGTEIEFRRELLLRARDHEQQLAASMAVIRQRAESGDITPQQRDEQLAGVEKVLAEAHAESNFAADKYAEVSGAPVHLVPLVA